MKNLFRLLAFSFLVISGCDLSEKNPVFYSIEANSCEFGTITPQSITNPTGTDAFFIFTPKEGYDAISAYYYGEGNGGQQLLMRNDTIFAKDIPEGNYTLTVFCEEKTCTVSISSTGVGTVTPTGVVSVKYGEDLFIKAITDEAHKVDSLFVNRVSVAPKSDYTLTSIKTNYEIHFVFTDRKIYTVNSSCDEYATITPSAKEITFLEGSSVNLRAEARPFCSLVSVKVNGSVINGTSYTFTSSGSFEVTSGRELEWYFNGTSYRVDSLKIGDHFYQTGDEVWTFSSDGTYIKTRNGVKYNRIWSLDKSTNPPTLKCGYGYCKILLLNDQRMIISYVETNGEEVMITFKRI